MSGWIKLHRKITDWEWWDDHNTTRLFLYIITRANHKDKNWRGIEINRGQILTSLDKLSKETGISLQKIRTGIKRLKSTHEITSSSTSSYTILTVEKYDLYQYEQQGTNTSPNKPITIKQQANNKQITTTNNVKNINKEKNVNKSFDSIESNGKITLIQHFGKCFNDYFGIEYHANFAKDGKLLKLLSNQYGEEKVVKGISYFFNNYIIQDEFAMENPNVGTFSIKWNSMIARSSGKKALTKQQKKMQSSIENIMEVDLD